MSLFEVMIVQRFSYRRMMISNRYSPDGRLVLASAEFAKLGARLLPDSGPGREISGFADTEKNVTYEGRLWPASTT
jgi:hypothetical protein